MGLLWKLSGSGINVIVKILEGIYIFTTLSYLNGAQTIVLSRVIFLGEQSKYRSLHDIV